jgi:hypothetical protein
MIDNPAQLWTDTLNQLALEMPRATFDQWLSRTRVSDASNGALVIAAHNRYAVEWLDGRLRLAVERVLYRIVGEEIPLRFVVDGEEEADPEPAAPVVDTAREAQVNVLLETLGQIQDPHARAVIVDQLAGLGVQVEAMERAQTWTPPDVDTSGSWMPVPEYANKFWAPLLGRVAFRVWMIVRQYDTRPARVKAQNDWTPARRFTAPSLAREVPCGPQAIKGVWRKCAADDPGAVMRKSRRIHGEDEGKQPYVRRPGALESLRDEGLAMFSVQGERRHKTYEVQVRIVPPVLSPKQVACLDVELQIAHDRWLQSNGVDIEEWRQ